MGSSTPARSRTSSRTSSKASSSATSSPGSEDGPSQPGLPLGPPSESYGQALARVSRSVLRGSERAPPTSGTYGPTFYASSVPDGPLRSWESRLRERLATVGSTESALIWREKRTPAGQSISRLSPSTPLTDAVASTGSRIESSPWPTPTVADSRGSRNATSGRKPGSKHHAGTTLIDAIYQTEGVEPPKRTPPLSTWPTPTSLSSQSETANPPGNCRSMNKMLDLMVGEDRRGPVAAPWVTPAARDWKDTAGMALQAQDGRSRTDQLPRQMSANSGPEPNGSSVTTEKRGGPNPAFPCWLMGYGAAWLYLAPTDSASPRSRKKPAG